MKFRHMGLSCAALVLFGTSFTFAQQPVPSAPPVPKPGEKTAEAPKEAEKKTPPEPEDKVVATKHSARIGGQEIKYTATAGMLVMKDEEGKPKASVFYVAYTRDDVNDLSQRPVTFTFNGGPGSASVWLHLGAFGPRRVAMGDAGSLVPPPYKLVDNESSLLDVTDLVFIDVPRPENRRVSFMAFKKTSSRWAISSVCMRRATSVGLRRNSLPVKVMERRGRRAFPDICSGAMECI
jgi:carboxypeptidase C (cathepsin A)